MDKPTREMLAAAFAENDEVNRDFEQWQHRQQQQRKMERRSAPGALVHKTNFNARVAPPPRATATRMTDAESAPWNEWRDAGIARALYDFHEKLDEVLAQILVEERKRMRDYVRKHVAAEMLQEEIALQDIIKEVLRPIKGCVVDLPSWPKRKRDVA
jgi:hypothetical protein